MAGAVNEVNVFVKEALKCQVYISNDQKTLNLSTARNEVMQVVEEFLPDSFIFMKQVGDQHIPVAHGQEDVVSLEKCLVEDKNSTLCLYIEDTGKRPLSTSFVNPKPKRLRQQSVSKYLTNQKNADNTVDYSAARGRVFLYSKSHIERATDRRRDYYKFWNEKAEELCSSPSFDKYSKQELHGIIDSHWRMHATSLCIKDAELEQQLVESLSRREVRGHKLLLSAKTVSKNIALLKEEDQKIKNLSGELPTLRAGAGAKLLSKARNVIQSKEQEMKESLTQLKLVQDRLRKSVDNLAKSRTKVLASLSASTTTGKKRSADSGSEEDDQINELEIDEKETSHLAWEAVDESF